MSAGVSLPPVRYHALDALRGLAAVFVVLHHGLSPFGLEKQWVPHAQLAVDLFFGLSGWVLAAAYAERLQAGLGVMGFMRLRAVRLLPMAWLGLVLGLAVWGLKQAGGGAEAASGAWRSLLLNTWLLPDLWPGAGGAWWLNVPLWSLSVEMLLSLAFGAWWWRSSRGVLVACWLLGTTLLCAWAWAHGSVSGGHDRQSWIAGPIRGVAPFVAGLLLWRWRDAWQRRVVPVAWPVAGLLALMLWPGAASVATQEACFAAVGVPLIVALGASVRADERSARWMDRLGQLSFPLYALHYPVVQLGSGLARRWHLSQGWPLMGAVLAELVVALGLAWLAMRHLEAPLRRWLAGHLMR